MNKSIITIAAALSLIIVFSAFSDGHYSYIASDDGASAFFAITKKDEGSIRARYLSAGKAVVASNAQASRKEANDAKKVRVLIMAGHEPDFGGAEYKNLKERDMTLELALEMAKLFKQNARYEVILPRDSNGWNPEFTQYFNDNHDRVKEFVQAQSAQMSQLISNGKVTQDTDGIVHNAAPSDVADRLFGINMWANEHDIDMAIHVHFNDNPRRRTSKPGEYSGFTIYVPERQYSNSASTKAIADAVFERLSKYFPVSDMPKESNGVVEEQNLIAIGSRNTLDAPGMLIEYGYIYESAFQDAATRNAVIKDLAYETYLGVEDFMDKSHAYPSTYDIASLPHVWGSALNKEIDDGLDVYALQVALSYLNLYPPFGKTRNDCPLSGSYGPCTEAAVEAFQSKNGIEQTGSVGPKTLQALNDSFK